MSAPVVIGPRDVAELRVHLIEQWRPGRLFHRVMQAASLDPRSRAHVDAIEAIDQLGGVRRADNIAKWERASLERANLWWVSPAMGDLLVAAARSVPEDIRVADLPPFDRYGLVVFAEPLVMHSARIDEPPLPVGAFVFGPSKIPAIFPGRPEPLMGDLIDSVSVSFYDCVNLDHGLTPAQLSQLGAVVAEGVAEGQISATPTGARDEYRVHGDVWAPLGRSDWPLADQLGQSDLLVSTEVAQESYREDRKLYAAFVTLLHQEGIAQTTTEWPGRPVVRRVQRAGFPREAAAVRVVRLREVRHDETHEHDGEDHREWSHRWIVQGHWRNARVGPGRTQRRLVWVNPHIKGPADKPLVAPTVIKAWIR